MVDLLAILSDYNPKRLTNGQIRMKCPFRENHDSISKGEQSFFLSPDGGGYHCFSCKVHGNAVHLLINRFEVTQYDALQLISLGAIENLIVPYEKRFATPKLQEYELESILDYFDTPQMFLDRGFDPKLLQDFRVGHSFYRTKKGDDIWTISIPLFMDDRLVGVKYRADHNFWYSADFPKDVYIYNLHGYGNTVLVESETDTWRSIQNSIKNTSATLGAGITENQAKVLAKNYDTVLVGYDNDKAGWKGTEFAYHYLTRHGAKVLFIPYDATDPGECKKADWVYGVKNASDYADYTMQMSMYVGDTYDTIKEEVQKTLRKQKGFIS